MLTKTNVVYQSDGAGAGGETNPPVSPSAGGTVAVDANTLSKLVKAAIADELKPIKGEISGMYSRQDKDRNAFREFMDEVKKQQANGLSEDQAFTAAQGEITSRAEAAAEKVMLKEIHAKLFGSSSDQAAGTGVIEADVEATAELQRYGLNQNEPDAIELLRSLANLSKEAKEAKVNKFILGKVAPHQPPSPAGFTQAPAVGTNSPSANAQVENYKKEMIAARSNKSLAKGIKQKYEQMGVPVDGVVFSV